MAAVSDDLRELYIELVKKSLTCSLYEGNDGTIYKPPGGGRRALLRPLLPGDVRLIRRVGDDQRAEGRDWPALTLTMVGAKRLDNLQHCALTVLKDGVPGDFIETGIWRRLRDPDKGDLEGARRHRSHGVRGRLVGGAAEARRGQLPRR
jgi:hypothetical protein